MSSTPERSRLLFLASTAIFFLLVGLVLFSASMQRGLSHDEHMYVAGGELIARGAGLPYRDFPYLQMPNLALIFAGLFGASDYLLLSARVVSTLAALGSLVILFGLASRALGETSYGVSFVVAAGSVLLVINNPIFGYTSG